MTAATAQLSATEALLAQAAAATSSEVHVARLALIGTGGHCVRPMDRTLLLAGDGTAGRTLLAGDRPAAWAPGAGPSCAIRSCRLLKATERAEAMAAAAAAGVS